MLKTFNAFVALEKFSDFHFMNSRASWPVFCTIRLKYNSKSLRVIFFYFV